MLKALATVNWLAVGVADVALFAFGAVWFMLVVARAYRTALGLAAPPPPSALFIVGPFLCQTVTIIATAVLLRLLDITTYPTAIGFGAFVGIGYLLPMLVNISINPNFPRPMLYSLINAPFFLLGSVMVSAILVAMG